jgi:hypothetical protein
MASYIRCELLATGLVKKQIQNARQDSTKTGMDYGDGQLVSVRDWMEIAKVNENETRTQVVSVSSSFFSCYAGSLTHDAQHDSCSRRRKSIWDLSGRTINTPNSR